MYIMLNSQKFNVFNNKDYIFSSINLFVINDNVQFDNFICKHSHGFIYAYTYDALPLCRNATELNYVAIMQKPRDFK